LVAGFPQMAIQGVTATGVTSSLAVSLLFLWCIGSATSTASGACPREVSLDEEVEGRCAVLLPPLAQTTLDDLVKRASELIEGTDSIFPFQSPGFGYVISDEEKKSLDNIVLSREGGEKHAACQPHTYGDMRVELIAKMFLPGGRGELSNEDVLVDLGAGVAKVMATAALVSNASVRGVELSAERYKDGCLVLKLLEKLFQNVTLELAASDKESSCPMSRVVELYHGDLLDPPPLLTRPPSPAESGGALTFFSYANCLPHGLLKKMFRDIANNPHPCVRLLTSKSPAIEKYVEGLRFGKVKAGMYLMFMRDGDQCRTPLEPGDKKNRTDAAVRLGWGEKKPKSRRQEL